MAKIPLTPRQHTRIVRVLENEHVYYTDEFTHLLVFRDVIYLINNDTKLYGFDDALLIRKVMAAMSFN